MATRSARFRNGRRRRLSRSSRIGKREPSAAGSKANLPVFTLAERLGEAMAGLVGAEADEVVVTNSTTVNLHQLLATLFRPEGARSKILADS